MGTAALAARIQLPRVASPRDIGAGGLAFDELGGPLVAICGLVGGAGTSTVALALARQAAAASAAPVLLTESDPLRAGLAALAGKAAPHPLVELARRVADDAPPDQTFLELEPRLRLIAAAPRRCATAEPVAVGSLLREARAAHGLVIVDCATAWTAASPILAAATHILWSIPASRIGLARAQSAFDSDVMPSAGNAVEVLVATAQAKRVRVGVRALRRLAATRCERLILIPHSDAAARGERVVDESVARALGGLAPSLRRRA